MCIKARELLPQTLSTPFGFKEILTQYECNVRSHTKNYQTEDRECETARAVIDMYEITVL